MCIDSNLTDTFLCFQTWINVSTIVFSILLFFFVALIYNSSCPTCNPPSNPYWTMQRLLTNPLFYLICTLSPIAALLPRYFKFCSFFFFLWSFSILCCHTLRLYFIHVEHCFWGPSPCGWEVSQMRC